MAHQSAGPFLPSLFVNPPTADRGRSTSSGGGMSPLLPAQTPGGFGTPREAAHSTGLRQRRPPPSGPRMTPEVPRDDPSAPPTASLLTEIDRFRPLETNDRRLAPPMPFDVAFEAAPNVIEVPLDDRLASWIVVYGVDATADPMPILRKFWNYGDIIEHEPGRGNWIFLHFASKWQAEKALAQSVILLDGNATMVGAMRVTQDVALKFGLHLDADGASLASHRLDTIHRVDNPPDSDVPFLRAGMPPPQAPLDGAFAAAAVNDPKLDLLNQPLRAALPLPPPPRSGGLCARLMAYLFSWY
ncbi:hypothetical protein CTAYLR_000261 [Chrysophaeum taylorii]|uniref:RRM Nup35-type domain-containing protein n=1 Tax=Chrysophaeum taylorii TaxID=2483200 RepID=A0AAD7UGC6_9STRA|nr:hypothetical protein CTAYLR_000261 [Chrysophaeum taylorii]